MWLLIILIHHHREPIILRLPTVTSCPSCRPSLYHHAVAVAQRRVSWPLWSFSPLLTRLSWKVGQSSAWQVPKLRSNITIPGDGWLSHAVPCILRLSQSAASPHTELILRHPKELQKCQNFDIQTASVILPRENQRKWACHGLSMAMTKNDRL